MISKAQVLTGVEQAFRPALMRASRNGLQPLRHSAGQLTQWLKPNAVDSRHYAGLEALLDPAEVRRHE